jgi:hypothetical protein
VLGAVGPALPDVYDAAFTGALHTVFVAAIGIVVLGTLLALARVRPARAPVTAEPEPTPCTHLDGIVEGIEPGTPDGCAECLAEGRTWVDLRLCLGGGHVGCCDDSPGRHAAAHWRGTGHPLVRSWEPGEEWLWCYADEVLLAPQS